MKSKSVKKFGIAALVTAIILTTAVTFVLWLTTISGNTQSGNGDITIGNGRTATTTVSLSEPDISEDKLIPLTVTPIDGESHTITIEFDVSWIADEDPAGIVTGEDGILVVECLSVIAEGSEVELLEETVAGDAPLFLINLGGDNDDGIYGISGNSADAQSIVSTTVTITVQLNEPDDLDQYLLIAGKNILITFGFEVTHTV